MAYTVRGPRRDDSQMASSVAYVMAPEADFDGCYGATAIAEISIFTSRPNRAT
jgi:hypothetical protein